MRYQPLIYTDEKLLALIKGQVDALYTSTSGWAPIPDPATPQPLMCACGKVATRLVGFNTHGCTPMCRECDMTRLAKAKPEPPPGPTHCGCGASFATVKRFQCVDGGTEEYCGDCWSAKGSAKIDARIRAAREGRDEDPTTWTAGATPGWEWP